jgi:putative salt-induced outer membrane protein YdiY
MQMRVATRNFLVLAVGAALLAGVGRPALAQLDDSGQYTDRIHLKNGDVITGNMKELDRGKLRLKTRTMDTVFINWVDIESIDSNKYLRIEKADGTFSYGQIQHSDLESGLVVGTQGKEAKLPILSVSTIQPIRVNESFWRRLEGDASAGIDYTKGSDILLINLSSNLRFREEKYELSFGANWNETSRTEENNSSRADLNGVYTRFLRDRWFWKGSAGFERNEELGLDLRMLVSGSAGRYLAQTPTLRFELNAGLAGNLEQRQDGESQSIEGMIRSSLDIFKYSLPVTRLSANISIFPGITESDRIRTNADISMRNEIVRSVFWKLMLYHTYDNRPPEGSSEDDYGIVTSIGASF